MLRVFGFIAVLAAFGATTASAWADEPAEENASAEAKTLLSTAMSDLEAGRFDKACPGFKKAYQEDARASTIFLLAECYEKWGKIATAAAHYEDYLAAFDKLTPSEQKEERDREELASARQVALVKKIPTIILRLPRDAPASTRVLRKPLDGGPLVRLSIGVPLLIDPGEHVLTTEVPGRPPAFTRFKVEPGKRDLEVEVVIPKDSEIKYRVERSNVALPTKTPPLNPGISKRRVVIYTVGGLGAASIVGGLVTGAITWGQKDPIAANCLPSNPKICNSNGEAAKRNADIFGLVSTILFPAGAVAVGTAIALYVTEPPPSTFDASSRMRVYGWAGPGTAGLEFNYRW